MDQIVARNSVFFLLKIFWNFQFGQSGAEWGGEGKRKGRSEGRGGKGGLMLKHFVGEFGVETVPQNGLAKRFPITVSILKGRIIMTRDNSTGAKETHNVMMKLYNVISEIELSLQALFLPNVNAEAQRVARNILSRSIETS